MLPGHVKCYVLAQKHNINMLHPLFSSKERAMHKLCLDLSNAGGHFTTTTTTTNNNNNNNMHEVASHPCIC